MKFDIPIMLLIIPTSLIIFYFLTGRGKPKGIRWWLSFSLRSLVIILLVTLLAGIKFLAPSVNRCRIYLLDNSGSIFLNQVAVLEAIQKDVRGLKPDDRAGLIVFGADASIEIRPTTPLNFKNAQALASKINPQQTDIVKALRLALDMRLSGYQTEIVFLSDGQETTNSVREIIPLLQNQGVPVFTLPSGPQNLADLAIDEFYLSPIISENQPVTGRLILSSTVNSDAVVYLYSDGKIIKKWSEISLVAGEQLRLPTELPPSERAVQEYEAVLFARGFKELCTDNNRARAITVRRGKPTILYLTTSSELTLVEQIISHSALAGLWQVDRKTVITGTDALPLDNLYLYDVIILDNIPGSRLKPEHQKTIKYFVEHGGGLLLTGGKNSYALGGYQKTILEEIAPVWFTPPDNLALVLILDRSGSMAEPVGELGTKWQVVRRVIPEIMPFLSPRDEMSLALFNDQSNGFPNLNQYPEPIKMIEEILGKFQPSGSTIILPPIKKAANTELKPAKTARKHIILLSDGTSTTGETPDDARKLAEELKTNNITISTLATGETVNEVFLKTLNQDETNGRFHRITDFRKLSEVLKEDLSYHKGLYKENVKEKVEPRNKLKDLFKSIPLIAGYNCTTLKERAELLADISNVHPLLAGWHYGKGRVLAFTSAPAEKWMPEWLQWNQLGEFWQFLIQEIIPVKKDDSNLIVETTFSANHELTVRATSRDNNYNLNLSVEVVQPTRLVLAKDLRQIAPGRYETIITGLNEGNYIIYLYQQTSATERQLVKTTPLVIPYSAEWRRFGINYALLETIAQSTGGKVLKNLSEDKEPVRALSKKSSFHSKDTIILLVVTGLILLDSIVNYINRKFKRLL